MSAVWPLEIPPTQKFVLIALADSAWDNGYTYPSIETLCKRTSFGKTAVIEAVKWLESNGFLRADRESGRNTRYFVSVGANQSASRTSPGNGPVRETDLTCPPGGPDPSARRTLTQKNRKEPKEGERASRLTIAALPADWSDYCRQKRPELNPQDAWERFRDYWLSVPGAKGRKLDWAATWRNWVRECRAPPGATKGKVGQFMDSLYGRNKAAKEVIDEPAAIRRIT